MRISAVPRDWRTVTALATTLVFWGSAFPFIRLALRFYGPGHLTVFRFLTASAAMFIIALALRMPVPPRGYWLPLAGLSLLNVIGYHVLLNFGLVHVQAGPGALVVNTAPVFSYLAAGIVLRERVDLRAWTGLAVSLLGVSVMAVGTNGTLRLHWGMLLLLGCAVTWGLSSVLVKPLLTRVSSLQAAAMTLWFGTIGLLVFLPGLPETVQSAPAAATWSIVYLGVFPIAVCYVTWNYTLSRMPATVAVNYTYLIPVIALVEAYLMLGEKPAAASLAGGTIALAGVVLANARRREAME